MYLKSLVLKGFKSFADRSVLSLEPGITAIVGPNGSGKSNIADAVLWVLGERNAKNLRGQVMEDVIFAGSSARKSVSFAEVELILDNSQGELPVDFDEVSIARRMYRDGTSEYLINGALARRLDVLDILHDTGLGAGTHSIISQGSLDSILQSRPEDRRSLIEETAGVLKHKQRKARSERRLEQMDQHLARVNDVADEIRRQLGPLERKAKKAVAFKEYSEELDDLTVRLHVDSLKSLKAEWEKETEEERRLLGELEKMRAEVQKAEAESEHYQTLIREGSAESVRLNSQLNQATTAVAHLDSSIMLLSEKRRSADAGIAELDAQLENNTNRRLEAEIDRRHALKQLEDTAALKEKAEEAVRSLENELTEVSARRAKLDAEFSERMRERRSFEAKLERSRRELAIAQKNLDQQESRLRILVERAHALTSQYDEACNSCTQQEQGVSALETQFAQAQQTSDEALSRLSEARSSEAEAQRNRDAAQETAVSLRSQILALQEIVDAQLSERSSALEDAKAVQRLSGREPIILSLGITVEEGYENLIEQVLGTELSALLIPGTEELETLVSDLQAKNAHGSLVAMVSELSCAPGFEASFDFRRFGLEPLASHISGDGSCFEAACLLLSGTYIADDLHSAVEARRGSGLPLRIVTRDGIVIWENGKFDITFALEEDASQSMLSRNRRLQEAKRESEAAERNLLLSEEKLAEAKTVCETAEQNSFDASEKLATIKGGLLSSKNEYASTLKKRDALAEDMKRNAAELEEAQRAASVDKPATEELSASVAEMEEHFASMRSSISKMQDELLPVRDQEASLSRSLSDAKISASSLSERLNYAKRTVEQRERDLDELKKSDEVAKSQIRIKSATVARFEPIIVFLEQIRRNAGARLDSVQKSAEQSQTAYADLHERAMSSRDQARTAREELDGASSRISELKINIGKLEVQVQNEVNAIVEDCGLAIETALGYPEIENRAEAESAAASLKKRIHGLGTVNPGAAEEYEEVKVRYDYIAGQLADLNEARTALKAVDRAIDARMKDDFIRTFKEVNSNFSDIFALLFPGGSGSLTLVDPEDLEHTGVEVVAQPAGKKITKMSLMSGGEKSLVALALLFAVYKTRSTPFYILDEVEAALDDTNLRRLTAYLQELCNDTQLIMITHQRRTMESANVLFGVSMQSDGVTKVISQKLERALKYAQ